MHVIKLSEYAKREGIGYRAAWNRFYAGKIHNAFTNENGGIMIDLSKKEEKIPCNAIYARVSTNGQKRDLDGQVKRCMDFANANGLTVHKVVKEIASGLNDDRPKLTELLNNEDITNIIVEHKDRLTRFGFNYIKTLLAQRPCNIMVVNDVDTEREDLMQDFISIITSFCARIYSKQRTKKQVEKIIELSKEDI